MVGALLELVALGEQDKYLIGKPEISFLCSFKILVLVVAKALLSAFSSLMFFNRLS